MKKIIAVLFLVLMVSALVSAQEEKAQVFAGYQFTSVGMSADGLGSARTSVPKGFDFDVAGKVTKNVAIVGDLGTGFKDGTKLVTFAGGPRFIANAGKVSPFAEGLFGITHITEAGNNFTVLLGGGLDVHATKSIAVRLAKFDYEYVKGDGGHMNNFRYAAGVVFKF